jgi:hypothetical protein
MDFPYQGLGLITEKDHYEMIIKAQDLDRFVLILTKGINQQSEPTIHYHGLPKYSEYAALQLGGFLRRFNPEHKNKSPNILCRIQLKRSNGEIIKREFNYVDSCEIERVITQMKQLHLLEYKRFLEIKRDFLKTQYGYLDMDKEFDLLIENELQRCIIPNLDPDVQWMSKSKKRKILV